jgi:two-component SAPR family response regulator
MTEISLIASVVLLVFVVATQRRRLRAFSRDTERTYSVGLPREGEIRIRVRTAAPLSACQWQRIRAATKEMAMSLQRPYSTDRHTLEVHALGPLIVRRSGVALESWGGPKAGTRQALAIFAFLLDRAERGAHRDEIIELIWPEADIRQADLAFHRTLGGLRRVLAAPDPRLLREVVTTREGIYRLNMSLVQWSDVDELEERMSAIEISTDLATMEAHLDAARRLYRGDYMDDCPFYADSSHVEARRQHIRDRYVSVLRTVAEARERAGRIGAAEHLTREALILSDYSMTPVLIKAGALRVAD